MENQLVYQVKTDNCSLAYVLQWTRCSPCWGLDAPQVATIEIVCLAMAVMALCIALIKAQCFHYGTS